MANLKERLAQKVEVLENNSMIIKNNGNEKVDSDNIIVLKSPEIEQQYSIVPDFAITLNDAKQRIEMLQHFVKEMMVTNVDYGYIPNCKKPSLFKSGAEKLCDIFGFSKQIEVMNRVEDWDKALFHYEVKAVLINKRTQLIESEGLGCCNNRERKFKGQDGYTIVNTLLKMAKKRAFIDAVLSATRSSGIFTQDIEDETEISTPLSTSPTDNKSISRQSPREKNINKLSTNKQLINKTQQSQLITIISQNKISIDEIKQLMNERYKVLESKLLSSEQAEDFIQYLKLYTAI